MDPQEIFEYKKGWEANAHSAYVNMDLWYDCRDFCKQHFEQHRWQGKRYMRNDDAHLFMFQRKVDHDLFVATFESI